jgi:hypothetical protein
MLTKKSSADAELLFRQVTESETFQAAPVMRTLLIYLWEHQGEPITEYAIAVDALRRTADFDPRADSTVRVQIARLRAKLKSFQEAAGDSFPLCITIPHGKHELDWSYRPTQAESANNEIAEEHPKSGRLRYAVAAGSILLLALAVWSGFLVRENQRLKALYPEATAALPRFWQTFVANGKPVQIVIPSPMYFFWPQPNISVRDYSVHDFPDWPKSPFLSQMAAKWGPPAAYQLYVGAPEMNVGVRFLQYLERHGRDVSLIESRRLPVDSPGQVNTILPGMPRTAAYLDPLEAEANFYIAQVDPDIIRNRKPTPGEPTDFREVVYAADREVSPSIIMLLPARPSGTRSLLLLGRRLNGMVSVLLSPEGLRQLDEEWGKHGSPDAWEMVISAEIQAETVLKITPVAFRAIAPDFWTRQ